MHHGVFGRKAGAVAGYQYSAALKGSGLVWDDGTLDKWLTDPQAVPEELRDEVTALASELGMNTGDVARALLEYGLEAYTRGELRLRPVMRPGRYTLFPEK